MMNETVVSSFDDDPRTFKIYRNKHGWPRWYQRFLEAWWILTGSWSLHKAWQEGMTYGSKQEYQRIIVNMGEISAQKANVKKANANLKKFKAVEKGPSH